MYESKKVRVFGDSAVTLRNKKTQVYSFSRAERFRSLGRRGGSEFVDLGSTFGKRAPGIGFGKRWSPEGRSCSPGPDAYCLPSTFCVSLGGYRKDAKVGEMRKYAQSPGPGTYDLPTLIGKDSPKFSIRAKIDITRYLKTPSPNAYLANLAQTSAFKNISFGIGEKSLSLTNRQTPGPGSYDIPSTFCKSKV